MNHEAQFYKSEYERLRRNKNKQIEQMRVKQSLFFDRTWKLLHLLGLSDKEIIEYYDVSLFL